MLLLAAFLLSHPTPQLKSFKRDDFGVPHIEASNLSDAWRATGYAVAQDRLWQMEMSRRTSQGRMAEVVGPAGLASDREVLKTAYTAEELQKQIDDLPAPIKDSFENYAKGVNDFIAEGNLPPEYAKVGLKPEPWTPIDSAAIAVSLFQYFGRGGAGAIRNMAALSYLQTQKPLQGHVLDVLDDFLWQNDPTSPTTVAKEDESGPHPIFTPPSREVSTRHMAMVPKLSLLELLPGLNAATRKESTRLAERVGAPFRTGSYCMVVGSKRSATGLPLLLSGPQMGFTIPSIVHEISIDTPEMHAVGIDAPGVPGILIGHTDHVAWGLTSGVADTDDVVFAPKVGADQYSDGSETHPLEKIPFTVHVKGGPDEIVTQLRTVDGVVLMSAGAHGPQPAFVFSKRSSYRNKELQSMRATMGLNTAKSVTDADRAAAQGTMSFNVFFADDKGHVGYRYAGLMPLRSPDLDPRFPTPADPKYRWIGMVPPEQMPHVIDPKGGLLTNWNNKPISWWPNLDTPVWGKIFRVEAIRRSLTAESLSAQDLELAAWRIARTDETWPYFAPYVQQAAKEIKGAALQIGGYDGLLLQGSRQAMTYRTFIAELRKDLFGATVGTFMGEQYATQIAQPSAILAALQGRTKFNYLQGRKAEAVVRQALQAAVDKEAASEERFMAGQIRIPDEPSIPYSNRGTYIQVIEMLQDGPSGRNVLPPGEAASGVHSRDQAPLSRAWTFKPMHRPWKQ